VASGTSSLTGNALKIVSMSALFSGFGNIGLSVPEPIFGFGILSGHAEVIHLPKPLCACTCSCPPTAFSWMQDFQRGDLEICIIDRHGNPLKPAQVTYTLFQLVRGCQLVQVGCGERKPASSGFGRYYVTGTAGEGGQPGYWVVRWRFRRSFGEPCVEQDVNFQVQDAIAAGDTTPRMCKYGWD